MTMPRFRLTPLFILLALFLSGFSQLFNPATIYAAALTITVTTAPEAYETENYSWQLPIVGGAAPYSCNVTGMPAWLTLDRATLTLTGKPPRGQATPSVSLGLRIGDSSTPEEILDTKISIPLRYHSTISVSSALNDNQASLYVDGQQTDRIAGGGKVVKSFVSGTTHAISVDRQISGSGDSVKFTAVSEKATLSGSSPDASFDYAAEYNIHVKTNMADMPALMGSGWYKTGSSVETTALAQYEPKKGVQYRFSHWQLPSGEVSGSSNLSTKVTKQGDIVANYDVYYELTFNTEYCSVNGAGWYKAGSSAKWNIACAETIPSPDFWGSLGVELKPDKSKGTVIVDAPKEIDINWKPDYTKLVVAITLGAIGALATIFITVAHDKIKQLINRIRGGGY
jgi:hypothetical protein